MRFLTALQMNCIYMFNVYFNLKERNTSSMQDCPYCTRFSHGNKLIPKEELHLAHLPQTNKVFQWLSRISYSLDINFHHLEDGYVLVYHRNSCGGCLTCSPFCPGIPM